MKRAIINKRLFVLLILFYAILAPIRTQEVITGTSATKKFRMKVSYERGLPPNLFADLQFSDENGNGVLEAMEKAELKLTILNKGKGPAQGMKIDVTDESSSDSELKFAGKQEVNFLLPDKSIEFTIPLYAGFDIRTGEHKLEINVLEYFGYDMDPAFLILNTLEYQAPKMVFSGYEVVDYGEGTGAIIEDGQIQPGELVKVKVFVQNIGQNIAENVQYLVVSRDPNVFIDGTQGNLGNMTIGEVKSFWLTVSPNKRINTSKDLPLCLNIKIDKEKGNLYNYQMPFALNKKPPETNILQVKADIDKLRQQVARFEYSSNKFTANVGKIINIHDVPPSGIKRNDAVAVVFGIENYDELPPAPYAENDANIVKEYFQNLMGINKVVTYTSDQARGLIFDDIFNPDYGELQKAIVKGQTDIFVFYSGHGIPSKNGEQIFLFPSDGKVARLELQGYNLNNLYENLEKLGAHSVTIFLDACFSGSSRQSEKIQAQNLVSMKGIRIKPRLRQPWENNPGFSVITSSGAEETSLALDASQTGLFTYYMCAGLKGYADLNNDKTITIGELYKYLKGEVMNTSKKISGLQTPEFHGNPETILVQF
jgi:hypothetical protein